MGHIKKHSKYSRRVAPGVRRSEKSVIVVVLVLFILLCAIISVAVGILLGKKAEQYNEEKHFDLPEFEYSSGEKVIKSVDAYAYEPGSSVSGYISRGITDLSLCVRDSEGKVTYNTAITEISEENSGKYDLLETVELIHGYNGYVCAYFYVKSFAEENESLRDLYKAYELALISEIDSLGVDDILLLGIDVNVSNIDEIERFVYDAANSVKGAAVGVALGEQTVRDNSESYILSRMSSVSDYVALNLSDLSADADKVPEGSERGDASPLETLVDELYYYLKSYGMRVVISKDNASLYDSLKDMGISNLQIVGK